MGFWLFFRLRFCIFFGHPGPEDYRERIFEQSMVRQLPRHRKGPIWLPVAFWPGIDPTFFRESGGTDNVYESTDFRIPEATHWVLRQTRWVLRETRVSYANLHTNNKARFGNSFEFAVPWNSVSPEKLTEFGVKLWTHKLFESRDNPGTTRRLTRGKRLYFLCFEANT